MKCQPAPQREKAYFAEITDPKAHVKPPIEVSFERPSLMDNPLAATAARLAKKHLEKRAASIEASAARIPLLPELPSDFPIMPSSPTQDTILEWLGSTQPSYPFPCPRSLHSVSPSQWSPFRLKAAKLSMAETPLRKPILLRRSDPAITVEHLEDISKTKLVTVPESKLLLLEAMVLKGDLINQLSDLKKDILTISLSEDNFITNEQRELQDDWDLRKIKKATEAGIDLLNIIQYNNPSCKDDSSVFQEAYDHWSDLRKSVASYLINRSGLQHENQIKWNKYIELTQKRTTLRAKIEEVTITISKLEEGNAENVNSLELDTSLEITTRKDSKVGLVKTEEVRYFPSTPGLHMLPSIVNGKPTHPQKVEIPIANQKQAPVVKLRRTPSKPTVAPSKKVGKPTANKRQEHIVKARYKSSKPEVNARMHRSEQ
ncbi:hypothetical protein BKA65DRAFT_474503 [Rhexocercosporidium sp. MPI-PUGE-AT-0058]|nr:hypothetical protein BKA65DRAFT_474503 [Rhexocercosporidium sp. MPI-PUGE-AT-0058]